MRTIEERAEKYVRDNCAGDCALCDDMCRMASDKRAFVDGAQSEHEELTRWHDPAVSLPKHGERVIVRLTLPNGAEFITGGWFSEGIDPMDGDRGWNPDITRFKEATVTGWREIAE